MQLVTEHGKTAGLQHDERHAGIDRRREHGKRALERTFGAIEHPVVVVRPAAADALLRQLYRAAGGFQHTLGGERGLRAEVVVERVVEQYDWVAICARREPGAKSA